MDITTLVGNIIYVVLGLLALWGAFSVVMVLYRVGQKRFRNEDEQDEFLTALKDPIAAGDFETASEVLEGDQRAMCQLAWLGVQNRDLGFRKVRQLVAERFQRDILADLDYRLSWVHTVIKSAPMVGLLGTVIGMMGAFGKLATQENVDPTMLASDIMIALITTASGLAIAIPLVLCVTVVNIRIRKMEDLTATGLNHFLDLLKPSLESTPAKPSMAGGSR